VILGIVILLICVGLSGCEEVTNSHPIDESRFIGKWRAIQLPYDRYMFPDNSSYSYENFNMTWEFFEDNIIYEKMIYKDNIENISQIRWDYEIIGQTIELTNYNFPSNFTFEYRYEFSKDYNTLSLDYRYKYRIFEDYYVFTRII
jgi:hypothetical protein